MISTNPETLLLGWRFAFAEYPIGVAFAAGGQTKLHMRRFMELSKGKKRIAVELSSLWRRRGIVTTTRN